VDVVDVVGDGEEEGCYGVLEEAAAAVEDVEVWVDEPSTRSEGCPVHDFWC
jgi:hypothetical protein